MGPNSDLDLLDDTFEDNEYSVIIEGVKVDKFKVYTIKGIGIHYDDLRPYAGDDGSLLGPVEKSLFLLKDYLHFTSFRKEKHEYYSDIESSNLDFLNLRFPFSLEVSNSRFEFYIYSLKLKLWYYGNLYLWSGWFRKN